MPVDPKTGEPLPYAGEPGAAPGTPPRPEGGLVPSRDLKPLMDEADRILAEAPEDEGAEPVEDTAVEGEEAPAEEALAEDDVTPIAEALDIDQEQAQRLFDAAKKIPMLADKTPTELADMLKDDFQLRMRLEAAAAEGDDMAAEAMGAEGFGVPAAGPPPGPGPMPAGGPE